MKVKEPQPSEFEYLRARPDALDLPPPGGLPRGRQGAAEPPDDGHRVRDGAARRRAPSPCWPRCRRSRAAWHPRPVRYFLESPQGRAGRAARRRARGAAGAGRGARGRQRGLERGLDRRGHGGRGAPARQEPRPPPVGRPDPPRSHHDPGLQPGHRGAGRRRGRPGDRRGPGRRRTRPGRGERRHGDGHEARARSSSTSPSTRAGASRRRARPPTTTPSTSWTT